MNKFDVKNFVALIAFHDVLRNAYFDIVEAQGINSKWDVYHVLADEETISIKEEEIMRQIYKDKILGNKEFKLLYDFALQDFRKNVRNKITANK